MKDVTIYDVAEQAQVSISTVSLALNHPARLKLSTLDRVLQVADDLGFVPKERAVVRARKGVHRIAAVAPFTSYPSFSRRLAGVFDELGDRGEQLVVSDCADIAVSASPVLANIPVRGHVDGLLNLGVPLDEKIGERLRQRLPTVLLDTRYPGLPDICVDDHEGGRLVAEHLAALGHRTVAFLNEVETYPFQSPPVLRLAGLRSVLGEDSVVEITVPRGTAAGAAAVSRLWSDDALRDRVTAVVGCRDLVALGALAELRSRGVDVPGDVSVLGFDDDPVAEALGLSTVRHPFEESGRLALRTLRRMLAAPGEPIASRRLPLTLVPRATSGPAAG
ncbi:LacI family DNA-binding transcriptional regulator [Jiangella alkaliphila]|uniref:LacI family transcriptional regulator n=1 Tax=Jiangella alkaliphila TaxID=419479 RepID=A0A1H2LYJ2_9ACTN|nr:LacI family DNA-binding transcriptional regulator [Jiangella alkaliphila]SDU86070.1 LacI family transcriptional regulator [Jiangella alkaliphila]